MTTTDPSPSTKRYLQIYNPPIEPTGDFHLFPKFPVDVRWLIWEQALSHERWIGVELEKAKHTEDEDKARTCRNYDVIVDTKWELKTSNLFRTTSESRRVALAFYRVQIPCLYKPKKLRRWHLPVGRSYSTGPAVKKTLYICPELDTLNIQWLELFEYFAYDVWASDPRRVGLVNLGLRVRGSSTAPIKLSTHGRDTTHLKQALLRIEHLTINAIRIKRMWHGFPSQVPGMRYHESHRSVPIRRRVVEFQRLPNDPRINKEHLKRVYVGRGCPLKFLYTWFKLLMLLGVRHNHKVDYRFAVYYSPSDDIHDRESATEWVKTENERFTSTVRRMNEDEFYNKRVPDRSTQGLEQAPQQAIGFWLFPIECLGPMPDANEVPGQHGRLCSLCRRICLDMSEHMPQLCLSELS